MTLALLPTSALADAARELAADSLSPRTRRIYGPRWQAFAAWCESRRLTPLPASPATLALYLAHRAQACAVATIALDVAAVSARHRSARLPNPADGPEVAAIRAGLRRRLGVAQRRVAPITPDQLRGMLATLPATLAGTRDRALLVIGWAGAFRRAELCALDVADLAVESRGLRIVIRRSKTDQESAGRTLGLPRSRSADTCPVRTVAAWLDAAQLTAGPLWRSVTRWGSLREGRLAGADVARLVKRTLAAAGLDPRDYAGHSLRAGLITAAIRAGASTRAVRRVSGHASDAMLERYVRDAEVFDGPGDLLS